MLKRFAWLPFIIVVSPWASLAQEVTPGDLEALARFSERLQLHYQAGLEISAQLDSAEDIIDMYVTGDLGESEMKAQVAEIQHVSLSAAGEFQRGLANIGDRPRLPDRKREDGLRAFEDVVRGLTGHLAEQQKLVERMLVAALDDDIAGYNAASADSLALTGRMIEAENLALEVSVQATSAVHPQTSLSEAVIGSNLAALAALILIEDSLRGNEPRVGEARDAIATGLSRASAAIDRGRRNSEAMWSRIAEQPATTESDKLSKQFLFELSGAYGDAFDVEAEIAAVMRQFLDTLVRAMNNDSSAVTAFGEWAASFQEDMSRLSVARMEEQSRRYRMVQEYSAAIGAAR